MHLSQAGLAGRGEAVCASNKARKEAGKQELRHPAANFSLLYESDQIKLVSAMEFATPDHQGKASSYRADDSYLTIKRLEVW